MFLFLRLLITCCVYIGAHSSVERKFVGSGGFASESAQRSAIPNMLTAESESIDDVKDVVVVGCGLSGCAAAFYLKKRGMDVVVAEAADEVGGNMISKRGDGYIWEEGPNSFQPSPTFLRFVKDLELVDQLVFADGKLPRFIFWDEKLHPLPSKLSAIPSFELLSGRAKLRAGLGLMGFIRRKPVYEESIMDFVERHLGKEVFERIVDPFVSGVYAGDPRKLSMKAALGKMYSLEDAGVGRGLLSGGVAKMFKAAAERKRLKRINADLPKVPLGSLGSFQDGLQTMAHRVKEKLGDRVRLSHKLIRVERHPNYWLSVFETPVGIKVMRSKALLVTTPSKVTAGIFGGVHSSTETQKPPLLLQQQSEQIQKRVDGEGGVDSEGVGGSGEVLMPEAAALAEIECPPVVAVVLAYPNEAFKAPIKGFGHLIPRSMKVRTLGSIWSSSLFPGRAPPGYTLLTNFIGGSQDPFIANLTKDEIVAQVHADLKRTLLLPSAAPPKVIAVKLWPLAIPQYNKGHGEILQKLEKGLENQPGLFLGGNYRTGVALGNCIQFGMDIVDQIQAYLLALKK